MTKVTAKQKIDAGSDCFVIMPIADSEGYETGHFKKVYEDIFRPACENAGFTPCRADDITQTNLIHEDILRRLIESPMAICDLSSRNPNVLFELGLRQAFDKPTVLVQEVGTPRIFDIAPLRFTQYRRELRYREVLEDQKTIEIALSSTADAAKKGDGINSIVRILSLSGPATLASVDASDTSSWIQLLRAEMSEMRSDLRRATLPIERARQLGYREGYRMTKSGDAGAAEVMSFARLLTEAEDALHMNAPATSILTQINKAQQGLASLIESGRLSERLMDEAKEGFVRAEMLERKLSSFRLNIPSKES